MLEVFGMNGKKKLLSEIIGKSKMKLQNMAVAECQRQDETGDISAKLEEYYQLPCIDNKFLSCESPEDMICHHEDPALYCFQIDDFYDVVLETESNFIKANKCILVKRCPYFAKLFTQGLKESSQATIKLPEIPRVYLSLILQYIYTDTVSLPQLNKDYEKAFQLLIYADYFMLPRLVDVFCQFIILY